MVYIEYNIYHLHKINLKLMTLCLKVRLQNQVEHTSNDANSGGALYIMFKNHVRS